MLRKLYKYETKATARMFLPLYGALILFAVINKIFLSINAYGSRNLALSLPAGVSTTVYVLLIIAIFALTFVVMIQRFYKNLLKDEGYLMFTLPVKPWKHIVTKLLNTMMWVIVSLIVTMISGIILIWSKEALEGITGFLHFFFTTFNYTFGLQGYIVVGEFCLLMLTSLALGIQTIYTSISIGQLSNQHKLLVSFAAFLGINVVSQIIVTILISIAGVMNLDWLTQLGQWDAVHMVMTGGIILNIIFFAACYIVCNYLLNRHLNLE